MVLCFVRDLLVLWWCAAALFRVVQAPYFLFVEVNGKQYQMPRSCDVLGCPNGTRWTKSSSASDPNVIYHWVPDKEPRRSEWLSAVPIRRWGRSESRRLVVCSLHFRPGDYEVNAFLSKSLGLARKAVLSRNAVPSILPDCFGKQEAQPEVPSGTATLTWARDVENQTNFQESLAMKIGLCAGHAKQVQCCLIAPSASIGVQVNTTVKDSKERGTQVDMMSAPAAS